MSEFLCFSQAGKVHKVAGISPGTIMADGLEDGFHSRVADKTSGVDELMAPVPRAFAQQVRAVPGVEVMQASLSAANTDLGVQQPENPKTVMSRVHWRKMACFRLEAGPKTAY